MIILCNENEMEKKRFKKVHKIIISYDLENLEDNDYITHLNHLIPPYKLMNKYYSDEISMKKYKKKYFEYLEEDQVYATILTLLLGYKESKQMAFVCSNQERGFLYMQFLLEFIHEKFGVPVLTYADWKKKDFPNKFGIDKDTLKKQVKKYKHIIFEDEEEEVKSNKKKKKDKKKVKEDKQNLSETKERDTIKRIKVRRLK